MFGAEANESGEHGSAETVCSFFMCSLTCVGYLEAALVLVSMDVHRRYLHFDILSNLEVSG